MSDIAMAAVCDDVTNMNVAVVEETLERLLFGHHDTKPATLLPTGIAKPISIACAVSRQMVTFVGGRVESLLLATEAHLQPTNTAPTIEQEEATEAGSRVGYFVSPTRWLQHASDSLRYTLKSMAFMSAGMTALTAGSLYFTESILGSNDTSAGMHAFVLLSKKCIALVAEEDDDVNHLTKWQVFKALWLYSQLQLTHGRVHLPATRYGRQIAAVAVHPEEEQTEATALPVGARATQPTIIKARSGFLARFSGKVYPKKASWISRHEDTLTGKKHYSHASIDSGYDSDPEDPFLVEESSASTEILSLTEKTNILLGTLHHYVAISTAAYGYPHLRAFGYDLTPPSSISAEFISNKHVFAQYANIPLDHILASSDSFPNMEAAHKPISLSLPPLKQCELIPPHFFVSVDHERREIVLTIRGTVGLAEMVTNLTCDAATFTLSHLPGTYRVHRGILANAQYMARIDSVIHRHVRAALARFEGYNLTITGHSLGGAVGSLIGLLWTRAQPAQLEQQDRTFTTSAESGLPAGRQVHVYVFGPPCVCDTQLSKEMYGLVTSVTWQFDFISTLKLSHLRPLSLLSACLNRPEYASLMAEKCNVKDYLLQRSRKTAPKETVTSENDLALQKVLYQTCRAHFEDLPGEDLYPPGRVYWAHQQLNHDLLRLEEVENVHQRFHEVVIMPSMFNDHNPRRLQEAISTLYNTAQSSI